MPQDPDPKKRSGRKKTKIDPASSTGRSWFLGIGINEYHDFPPLRNAVRDVEEIVKLLQERYDVATENTITIYDKKATRRNIINTLDRLENMVGPKDKLIIYYSGHGHLNKRTGKGYWIPTDAEQDNTAAYIRNSTIREYIETLQTLHTLLISDSCFSGSMFVRGTKRSADAIHELERIPSRWAMCSGRRDEEVFDGEPGGHSPFAESILDTLKSNQHKELNVAKLVDRVIEQTRSNYQQLPEGNPMYGVGHKGGQYVFRLKADEAENWTAAMETGTLQAFQQFLINHPDGLRTAEAKEKIAILKEDAAWQRAVNSNTISAYILYRRDYPEGRYRDQAMDFIRELEEDQAWRIATRRNTITEYEGFLDKYPDGKYKKEAEIALNALLQKQQANLSKEEDAFWESVHKKDTLEGYKKHLKQYPSGLYLEEAKKRIEQLKTVAQKAKKEIPKQKPGEKPSKKKQFKWKVSYKDPVVIGYSVLGIWILIKLVVLFFDKEDPTALIQQIGTDMVLIQGGTFTMGCQEQRDGNCRERAMPAHEVTLDDFYIGRYEVTQAQWRAVMGRNPRELHNKGCDACPVEGVSWNDIQYFLQKLNQMSDQNYRLSTEAEWEFAASGGNRNKGYKYSGSNNIDEVAWYIGNYRKGITFGKQKTTRPVGRKKPNELGLYDMSGNVSEWVQDCWHENYNDAPKNGIAWMTENPSDCRSRVFRGGSYASNGFDRVSVRSVSDPSNRSQFIGFRLVQGL